MLLIPANNQYPESFMDHVIKDTLHKILANHEFESVSSNDSSNISVNSSIDSNA